MTRRSPAVRRLPLTAIVLACLAAPPTSSSAWADDVRASPGENSSVGEPVANAPASAGASAGEPGGPRSRRVWTEGTFAPAAFGEPACDAAGRCAYPLSRTGSRVTGSFEGTSVAAGAGIPIGTGFAGTGIQVFTGSVEGCGEGSLVLTESLTSTDGVTSSGTWQIVAGSGTGGLDVRGGGTFIAVQRPDGSGSTTSSGRIRC